MYKREEAEQAVRHLATQWADEVDFRRKVSHYPSFSDFRAWVRSKGYGGYFNFRSEIGCNTEAEGWFESEIQASWRWRET
jgi:hypothetical protein